MEEKNLGQAKRRNKKVEITEIAIEKVPFIEYKGLTEEQNKKIEGTYAATLSFLKRCSEVGLFYR